MVIWIPALCGLIVSLRSVFHFCPNTDFQGNPHKTLVTYFHNNSVCITLHFGSRDGKSIRSALPCIASIGYWLLMLCTFCRSVLSLLSQLWDFSNNLDDCFITIFMTICSSSLPFNFVQSPMNAPFHSYCLVNLQEGLVGWIAGLPLAAGGVRRGSCYFSSLFTEA